jgi:hypothetical protein
MCLDATLALTRTSSAEVLLHVHLSAFGVCICPSGEWARRMHSGRGKGSCRFSRPAQALAHVRAKRGKGGVARARLSKQTMIPFEKHKSRDAGIRRDRKPRQNARYQMQMRPKCIGEHCTHAYVMPVPFRERFLLSERSPLIHDYLAIFPRS